MKPPIFLFGSGRCGSTLLQRILNTHKDIVMWGEHEGFLAPLAKSFFRLRDSRNMKEYVYGRKRVAPEVVLDGLRDQKLDICWVNSFHQSDVVDAYRDMLVQLLAGTLDTDRVFWGFKEIRYRRGDSVHKMLRILFPQARYLFLFRNPVDMTSSAIMAWRGNALRAAKSKNELKEFVQTAAGAHFQGWYEKNSYLLEVAEQEDLAGKTILYEDLIDRRKNSIADIFEFLGLDVPYDVGGVLDRMVSSTSKDPLKGDVQCAVSAAWQSTDAEIRDFAARLGYRT